MKVIALIPARGGSKRLPGKNLKKIHHKPLIAYSIETSLESHFIEQTFVSTEDASIAHIAKFFGARIIDRPVELATDEASTLSVVIHALEVLDAEKIQDVILLQPTCPYRLASWIDRAYEAFNNSDADALVSISPTKLKLGKVENGFFIPNYIEGKRKQDMEVQYKENGVLYIVRSSIIRNMHCLFGSKILPWLLNDPVQEINIDTLYDFHFASILFSKFLTQKKKEHLLYHDHLSK